LRDVIVGGEFREGVTSLKAVGEDGRADHLAASVLKAPPFFSRRHAPTALEQLGAMLRPGVCRASGIHVAGLVTRAAGRRESVVLSPFLFQPYGIDLKPPAVDLRDTIFGAGKKWDPHLPKRNLLAPSGLVPGESDEFLVG